GTTDRTPIALHRPGGDKGSGYGVFTYAASTKGGGKGTSAELGAGEKDECEHSCHRHAHGEFGGHRVNLAPISSVKTGRTSHARDNACRWQRTFSAGGGQDEVQDCRKPSQRGIGRHLRQNVTRSADLIERMKQERQKATQESRARYAARGLKVEEGRRNGCKKITCEYDHEDRSRGVGSGGDEGDRAGGSQLLGSSGDLSVGGDLLQHYNAPHCLEKFTDGVVKHNRWHAGPEHSKRVAVRGSELQGGRKGEVTTEAPGPESHSSKQEEYETRLSSIKERIERYANFAAQNIGDGRNSYEVGGTR
ncbi:unnamed protein product, partial [Choristocarpus tenellus]